MGKFCSFFTIIDLIPCEECILPDISETKIYESISWMKLIENISTSGCKIVNIEHGPFMCLCELHICSMEFNYLFYE